MAARAEQTHTVSPDAERMLLAMGSTRERTFALVSHLADEQLEARPLADHEPARVGPRPHSRLRGSVAGASATAGASCCVPISPACMTPSRRHERFAARSRRCTRRRPASIWRRCASVPPAVIAERGVEDGVLCELVLRHELQHCETMRQTLAIAGLLAPQEQALAERPLSAPSASGEWLRVSRRAVRDGRRR